MTALEPQVPPSADPDDPFHGIAPPTVPLTADWQVGLSRLIRATPKFPDRLGRFLGPFDRFAELGLSADALALDGEDVAWSRMTEVRLGSVLDLLSTAVVDHEVDRLAGALPPVPGRRWAVRKVTEFALGFALAAVEPLITQAGPQLVPVSFAHRGRLSRRKELVPGLFPALFFTTMPQVTGAVLDLAGRHGAGTSMPPPGGAQHRADQLRDVCDKLRRKLKDVQEDGDEGD